MKNRLKIKILGLMCLAFYSLGAMQDPHGPNNIIIHEYAPNHKPILSKVITVDEQESKELPNAFVICFKDIQSGSSERYNALRNPTNPHQFFILNGDELTEFSITGKLPDSFQSYMQKADQPSTSAPTLPSSIWDKISAYWQSPSTQEHQMRQLITGIQINGRRAMSMESAARQQFINRYTTPPTPYNKSDERWYHEILVRVADNFDDQESLDKLKKELSDTSQTSTADYNIELFNKASDYVKAHSEFKTNESLWPTGVRYVSKRKRQEKAQQAPRLTEKALIENFLQERADFAKRSPEHRLEKILATYTDNSDKAIQALGAELRNKLQTQCSPQDITEYLINTIALPDDTTESKKLYYAFFDPRGLPRLYNYNEEFLQGFVEQEFVKDLSNNERLLLFKFAQLSKENNNIIARIPYSKIKYAVQQGYLYLSYAQLNPEHKEYYIQLAHVIYNALTDQSANKIILYCHLFSGVPKGEYQTYLHDHTLKLASTILEQLENPASLHPNKRIELEKSLLTIDFLWQEASLNKKQARQMLESIKTPEDAFNAGQQFARKNGNFAEVLNQGNSNVHVHPPILAEDQPSEIEQLDAFKHAAAILDSYHPEHVPDPDYLRKAQTLAQKVINTPNYTLVNDLCAGASNFGLMSYEFHKQGYRDLELLCDDIGYKLYRTGEILVEETLDAVKSLSDAYVVAKKGGSFLYKGLDYSYGLLKDGIFHPLTTLEMAGEKLHTAINLVSDAVGQMAQLTMRFAQGEIDLTTKVSQAFQIGASAADIAWDYVQKMAYEDYLRFGYRLVIAPKIQTAMLSSIWNVSKSIHKLNIYAGLLSKNPTNNALGRGLRRLGLKATGQLKKLKKLYKGKFQQAVKKTFKPITDPLILLVNRTINKFIAHASHLKQRYGEPLVTQAMEILSYDNIHKLEKVTRAYHERPNILQKPISILEHLITDLKRISSDPRTASFLRDPDHNFNIRLGSVKEALAAIACETQGLLKELIRDTIKGRGDFIDKLGQIWDVKSPISYCSKGFKKFSESAFCFDIKKALSKNGENIILNISYLIQNDRDSVYNVLKSFSKTEIERFIIVDVVNANNSRKTIELLKTLGFK